MIVSGRSCRRAFTLTELLVVITIIAFLIAILLPAVQAAREAARRTQCTNNLKQVGLATMGYEQTHGMLPAGNYWIDFAWNFVGKGTTFLRLLPYVEQQPLYDLYDFNAVVDTQTYPNSTVLLGSTVLPLFVCPSDQPSVPYVRATGVKYAKVTYAASGGSARLSTNPSYKCELASVFNAYTTHSEPNSGGPFNRFGTNCHLNEINDGLSNTIFFGEVRPDWNHNASRQGWQGTQSACGITYTTIPINYYTGDHTYNASNGCGYWNTWVADLGFKSCHAGGAQFLLGDGSVHFFPEIIDTWTFHYLGDKNDGKAITSTW